MNTKNFEKKVFYRFDPDVKEGLTREQVLLRQKEHLVNVTKQKTSKPIARILFDNLFTYFNLIYVVIFIALLSVGSVNDMLFVLVVVTNVLIAIVQEINAKITVERLTLISTPKVKVVRDGMQKSVFANKLVLDDIIKLSVGNQVPSDCVLLEGKIDVNESLLTGESKAIRKVVGDKLLAGSFLTSGECYARIDKVGNQNYIQTIARQAKQFKSPSSNLFKDLKTIIRYIGVMIVPVGAMMFVNNYFGGEKDLTLAVIRTCASLIGMVPAGMFLLISIALSVGVVKLASRKTLVKDLYSIENLARANVLCLDKTGTITDGTMQVKEVVMLKDVDFDFDNTMSNFLASQIASNSTSRAMSEFFGLSYNLTSDEIISFSSEKKYSASSFMNFGTIAMGAPDFLGIELTKSQKQKIARRTKKGDRVILVGHSDKKIGKDDKLPQLEPIALVVIDDHIREDAIQTIEWFKKNEVEIKIISGDDPATVSSIAKRVGVEGAEKTISLEGMSLGDVAKVADKFTVFGRVTPEQKHVIVKTLKNLGKVVAMTGDGVNDTLALKEADCSIAMSDGSEVARGISHLVLLDSKFTSLPEVVKEGRKVVNNIQKSSSLYLMKTFFTIALSIIAIVTLSPYPFYPRQLYVLELFIIGLPSVILALQPNEKIIKGNFIKNVLKSSIPYGLILLSNILLMMIVQQFANLPAEEYVTLGTLMISSIGYVNLVKICWPLNKLRIITLITSLVLSLGALIVLPQQFGIMAISIKTLLIYLCFVLITALGLYFIPIYRKRFLEREKAKKELEEILKNK